MPNVRPKLWSIPSGPRNVGHSGMIDAHPEPSDANSMTRLLETYQALPLGDRRLVLFTGVYFEAILQTTLKIMLMRLAWRDDANKLIYQTIDSRAKQRLIDAGMWVEERNLFRCHPKLIDPLCEEARKQGLLEPAIAEARKVLPATERYLPPEEERRRFRRELRFSVLLGDEAQVFRALGLPKVAYFGATPDLARDIAVIFGAALEHASTELQLSVIAPLLEEGETSLANERARYERFEALFGAMPQPPLAIRNSLAERRFARGRFDSAAALAEAERNNAMGPILRAAASFVHGDDTAAIARFSEAVATLKKLNRKRAIHIPGLPGVFHLLALLREGSSVSMTTLSNQASLAARSHYHDPYTNLFALLDTTYRILQGKVRPDALGRPLSELRRADPWFDLFQSLCLRWVGRSPEPAGIQRLQHHRRQAARGGYLWYAREAALLLQSWGDDADYSSDIAALDCQPLTDLRQPEAAWERTLRLLNEIAAGPRAVPGEPASPGADDLRLVWNLDLSDNLLVLEPREQKRKGAGWTKGRVVSLKRLHEERDTLEYVTPEDLAICNCIRAELVSWGWHSPKTEYRLDSPCAGRAAVGHPRLFLSGVPVELLEDHPRILISREKSGVRIALHPPCSLEMPYTVVREGDRLRFCEFSPQHLNIGELLGAKGIQVPKQAEARVLQTISAIAPLITVHSEIGGEAGGEVEKVEADGRLYFHLQPLQAGLRITCQVKPLGDHGPLAHPGEAAASIFSEIDGQRLHAERDLKAERAAADRLFAACPALDPAEWDWPLEDPEAALETLENLQELGDEVVLEWPQGKAVRLARNAALRAMQVRVGGQRDWFAVSGGLTLDDGRVMDMTRLLQLLGETAGRFVKIGEDEYLSLSHELRRRLDAIRSIEDRGRVHPLAAGLLDEALDGMQVKTDKAWKAQMRRLAEAADLAPEVPSTLQAELREYQLDGFHWLARLAHWGAGACLADDMGLGKTVQALALLLAHAADGPALVLAPTSVCANWIEEAQRFAPTLNARLFGPGDRAAMLRNAGPFHLVVCSYGLLQAEAEALQEIQWRSIVADEAQAFKNPQTKRSKAVMGLQGQCRLITTGTPIENHLGELWNLFRFINPGLLGSQESFNERFANPIEQRQDKNARQHLKRLIRPFILRRLKSDVLTELPERTEITIHVELSDAERIFYEALRRTALERIASAGGQGSGDPRFQVLAEIMRLRRACCNARLVLPESDVPSSKLQAFTEIVEELRENRHKALVFSQFVDHLSLVRKWLDEKRIPYQYLDGSTPQKKRQEVVRAFQSGRGDLFLISLKAGGAGLNLTAADYVVHLDPWWNPAVEDQASDRAHRIGQQRPVTIYRLVARDTIEDRIIELHRHKRDLADSLLEGAEIGARLDVNEIIELLREGGTTEAVRRA